MNQRDEAISNELKFPKFSGFKEMYLIMNDYIYKFNTDFQKLFID